MKVIPFTIPVSKDASIIVQDERLPHFYPYLHRHREIQITLIRKGTGTLLAGSRFHGFFAGNIFLIGANQPHLFKSDPSYFDKRSKKEVQSLTLFLHDHGPLEGLLHLPEMFSIKHWLMQTSGGFQVPVARQDEVARLMKELSGEQGANRLALLIGLLQYLAALPDLVPLTLGSQPVFFRESEGQRMNQIYQYSLQNFSERIELKQIASVAHLTVPAFCRYFKKRTGKTYTRFLNELRINEACRLLITGTFSSMCNVAETTGFGNVSHFNRCFRQITRLSPREYKNLHFNK